ncbi:MAG: hypothetical protein ACRDP6_47215 [Actinoallomurus sp.]
MNQSIIRTPLTPWKSIPGAVRFAVWVWAVSVIASIAATAVVVLLVVATGGLGVLGMLS